MARETVTLALNSGAEVSVRDFSQALVYFDRLLRALSRAHTGRSTPAIEWQLEHLATGSAILTAGADHPKAQEVAQGYLRVGHALRNEEPVPYGKRVEAPATELLRMLKNGVNEIRFETSQDESVLRSSVERRPVAVPLAVSLGAVEGVVEVLSSRRGLYFNLYDALFDRPVSCYVSDEHADQMRDIWGKRVIVEGRVSRDPAGYAVAVRDISAITPVVSGAQKTWRHSRGAIAVRPGAPRPEEVIRKMRDAL